jgi:hypothetical protein
MEQAPKPINQDTKKDEGKDETVKSFFLPDGTQATYRNEEEKKAILESLREK